MQDKDTCAILVKEKETIRYNLQQQTEAQTTKGTCTERSKGTDRDTELYIGQAQRATVPLRKAMERKNIRVKDARGTYRRDRDNKKKQT